MANKEQERELLRIVFSEDEYIVVLEGESPDFVLKKDSVFGVEVTEYFFNETSARLKSQVNTKRILEGKILHKDDVGKIEVGQISVEKNGRWVPMGDAVSQENPSPTDRIAILVKGINEKTQKFEKYDKDLKEIDLVIADGRSIFMDGVNDGLLRHLLMQIKDRVNVPFRHVYFVIPETKEVIQIK